MFRDQKNQTLTKEQSQEEKKQDLKNDKRKGLLGRVPEELVDTMNSLMDGTVSDEAMTKLLQNRDLKRGQLTKLTEDSNYEELTKI